MSGFDLTTGGQADVVVDFDAARSVHLDAGTYRLQPVIRVLVNPAHSTGRIAGRVLPEGPQSFLSRSAGRTAATATRPLPA